MDHLLSMEKIKVEKEPYKNFGARAEDAKSSWKTTYPFYLVLRDYFSQDFVLWKLDNVKKMSNLI